MLLIMKMKFKILVDNEAARIYGQGLSGAFAQMLAGGNHCSLTF